jgi:hypothetical protein
MELLYASWKKKKSPLPSTPPLNDLDTDKEKSPPRTSRHNLPQHNCSLFKNHAHLAAKGKPQAAKNQHLPSTNQPCLLVEEMSPLISCQHQHNSLCLQLLTAYQPWPHCRQRHWECLPSHMTALQQKQKTSSAPFKAITT